jgi:hypothetical protein
MAPEKLTSRQQQEIRSQVAAFLGRTRSFHSLPKAKQDQALADTERIVSELAHTTSNPDPYSGLARAQADLSGGNITGVDPNANVGTIVSGGAKQMMQQQLGPTGSIINAGVDAAARMIREIDFPAFVKSLITGVFKSIVQSSIDQMKAYTDMVRSVATSLNDFKDRNTTDNQARDSLVQRYPTLLQIVPGGAGSGPTVGLRDDADTDNLPNFQKDLGLSDPITDIDDETIEQKLVPAARDDLARGRQQLLATLVLMGINRIVVTDGKINAKIQFKFSANERRQITASAYDYGIMGQQMSASQTVHDSSGTSDGSTDTQPAQPQYVMINGQPVPLQQVQAQVQSTQPLTAYDTSASSTPDVRVTDQVDTTQQGNISASGSILGEVTVNFKSDVFPLEKLVDTDQLQKLASAQGAGRGTLPPAVPGATPAGAGSPSAATGATPPAGGTTPPAQPSNPAPAPAH